MNIEALATYRSLLQEIKYRTDTIEGVLGGQVSPLRAKIAEELCYLQLRMICELIAIGCLVIHGDLKPKTPILKTYRADWIIGELSKLHPRFYLTPLEAEDIIGNDAIPDWVHKTSGFLTKDNLRDLWAKCGAKLHRGNAKNILVRDPPLEFPKVMDAVARIRSLLTRHIIISPDEEQICYFVMNADGTGNIGSNVFARKH